MLSFLEVLKIFRKLLGVSLSLSAFVKNMAAFVQTRRVVECVRDISRLTFER